MGKRNEEAGGGGEIGEAGRGVWNGREFRIHLREMRFDDVNITVTRRELTITERSSMNLITISRLPRTAISHFTPFMQNGFLVLRFDRVSFAKKIWNVLACGANIAVTCVTCVGPFVPVNDAEDNQDIADRQRGSDDQTNG